MSDPSRSFKKAAKKAVQVAFFPIFRYFGPRFGNILKRLDVVDHRARELGDRFTQFERAVTTDLDTTVEFALTLQRSAAQLDAQVASLQKMLGSDLARRLVELDPAVADYASHLIVGTSVAELGPGTAELINWANAGDGLGFAAQAGLWFNPPVTVEHHPGKVILRYVNERIVEGPYAMAAAGNLPVGSHVLDVGASESTLSLSLASMGLKVTSIDPRPYPFEHPNLNVVTTPIEEWEGPERPFDAIFCISTIEHLGVGAYGQRSIDRKLDRKVMDRMASWLAPGKELVLTTPYGKWSIDGFQRNYDAQHLSLLLEGWKVLDRRICVQTSDLVWTPLDEDPGPGYWNSGKRGVALLRATPEL